MRSRLLNRKMRLLATEPLFFLTAASEALSAELVSEFIYTDKFLTRYEVGKRYVELPVGIYDSLLEKFDKAKGAYVYENPTEEFPAGIYASTSMPVSTIWEA